MSRDEFSFVVSELFNQKIPRNETGMAQTLCS